MDSLLGITGKDFVLLGFAQNEGRSILLMKTDQEKMYPLSKNLAIIASGEGCEAPRFSQYIQRDYHLYAIRNGYNLLAETVARSTRSAIAGSLRTRNPSLVNVLVAGTNPETAVPELYWIDYLGTFCKMPYASHGYASFFTFSILDRYWNPEIGIEEATNLMKKCISEIQKRFLLQQPNFKVRVIDKDGTRDIEI